ncbi:metallophosphoesterase [Skermania piniformis]|uniref:Metallophosphoesterase n=1 Tax=Skermania pinensis TaxID=39122 RepID=A0ABX8SDE7_9ACTN|nr:metallophosphoesterase [Skermania piniformis]
MTGSETVPDAAPARSSIGALVRRGLVVGTILLLLAGLPGWTLLAAGADWPRAVVVVGGLIFAAAAAAPIALFSGLGRRSDRLMALGTTVLGVLWVLFVWSVLGQLLGLAMLLIGIDNPIRARVVASVVVAVSALLLGWGFVAAMRVPQVVRRDVVLDRLGRRLDGLQVALITDTHFGPINRARWSAGVVAKLNQLDADIVCHLGDIADGAVGRRQPQAAPLADVRARLARVYVTGNHEYFSDAQDWLDYMAEIGWTPLHNRHLLVRRGVDGLVIAGIDDATAAGSGVPGHGASLATALAGSHRDLPVLLLAHQPKQVVAAAAIGIDLQVSGHTHGGQIWPFNFLVRLDQPVVHGLSRHGPRTQLYTSRGTGFWGPPFRIFAPSEITLLTLRRP